MSSLHPSAPEIDFVPLGKLTVFAVTEGELLDIKRGSADSVFFAIGMACLFLCVPTALSIFALDPKLPLKITFIYATVAIVTGLAAAVLLVLWRVYKGRTHSTIETIMNRKPSAGVQSVDSPLPPAIS